MALKLLKHVHACKGGSIEDSLGQDAMCSWIASLPQVGLSPVPPQESSLGCACLVFGDNICLSQQGMGLHDPVWDA